MQTFTVEKDNEASPNFFHNYLHKAKQTPLSSSVVLLLIMGFVTYLYFKNPYQHVPGVADMNLFFHEFGHILTLGSSSGLLRASSGTIFQLILPVIATFYFLFRARHLEFALMFCWLGTNLCYTGIYMMDTLKRTMPLIMIFGPNSKHDWEVIFGHYALTNRAIEIGEFVLRLGQGVMVLSCLYVIWLIVYRSINKNTEQK